jgi:hypothetical protein
MMAKFLLEPIHNCEVNASNIPKDSGNPLYNIELTVSAKNKIHVPKLISNFS